VKALHIPNEAVNILRSAQSSIADLPRAKQLIKKATANISPTQPVIGTPTCHPSQCNARKSSLEENQGWPTRRPAVIHSTCSIRHPTHPFEPTLLEVSVWCQMFSVWKFQTSHTSLAWHIVWTPDPTHEEGSEEKPCSEVSSALECYRQC